MALKLLIDATVSTIASKAVAAAGHDVLWVGNLPAGVSESDSKVLETAAIDDRIVVTLDRNLGEHAVLRGQELSMLRVSGFKVTEQAAAILQALAAFGEELANGAVVSVEPGTARVRPFS